VSRITVQLEDNTVQCNATLTPIMVKFPLYLVASFTLLIIHWHTTTL